MNRKPYLSVIAARSGGVRIRTITRLIAAIGIMGLAQHATAQDTVITLNSGATDLTSPVSYTPLIPLPPAPNATTDILLATSPGHVYGPTLFVNNSMTTGSINDANGAPLVISNTGIDPSTLTISHVGANNTAGTGAGSAADAIYVAGGSNLTINGSGGFLTTAFTTSGNVDTVGTLAISSAVTLAEGTTVTFTGAGTSTISGPVSGAGAVAVNNSGGTVFLTATNSYTGGTTIGTGEAVEGPLPTLVVGGVPLIEGGPLASQALGTGPVANNGVLESTATTTPGSAPMTINVAGAYSQGQTESHLGDLVLQVVTSPGATPSINSGVAGTNYDTLNVTGTATLGGTLVLNFETTSAPSQGQRYVAVHAGAPLTTTFNLVDPTNLVGPYFTVTTYNDTFGGTQPLDSAIVTIVRPFATMGGLTPNQTNVARNVDNNLTNLNNAGALAMPTGANADFFNNIITGLNAASYGDLGRSLDQLSPQRLEVLRNVAFDNYAFDVQSLDDELARERYGNGGIDTSGFAFTDSALGGQLSQIKSRLLAWNPAPEAHGLMSDSSQSVLGGVTMTDRKDTKEITPVATLNKWNGFVDGGVDLGDLDHNVDVSHASYTTGRVRAGADYLVTDDLRVGALFGYGHTDADLDNEGSKAHIDSYTPGIYAAYADKHGFYANGLFTYTRNDYTTHRDIVIPGVNRTASGSPSGDQFGGDLDGGYEFHHGDWTFGPSVGVTYVNLGIDSFSESGAGAASLNVNNQSAESLRSRLGGTVRYQAKLGSVVLTPHLSAFWQHEFLDGTDIITSQFEGLPAGGSFEVQTIKGDSDDALLGLGLDAEITNSLTLFVDYQTEAGGANFFGQAATGGVKVSF